ncbi:MAG: ATPase [Rhodospirillaceae bacterium]|nr:ATPase [Rhodospirillaceae bacterium]
MKQRDVPHHQPRIDRRIAEHVHDPYKTRMKLPEPTVCPGCGAVYQDGRWKWPALPVHAGAHREPCQACRRVENNDPAGWVTISGTFVDGHRKEILGLVHHQEELEKAEHPLNRIIRVETTDKGIVVTTTDIHLPRRIGEALQSAYDGELDYQFIEETYLLRVHWSRN